MGSYRSAVDRASDQAVLTAADCPPGLPALDAKGRANWLAEGETITYWTRLPHGATRRIASASTHASVDAMGRVSGTYDVGSATLTKYAEGIVTWSLTDGAGQPVPWDPRQAATLLDGVPDVVLGILGARIGNGEPPPPVEPSKEGEQPEPPEDEGATVPKRLKRGLVAFARGHGNRAPGWLVDLLVAEHYHLSPDDVDDMPEWLYQRAVLWLGVVAEARNEQSEGR